MQKNVIIGVSIVAVVLLVLALLSNVVGYQTIQSSNPYPIVEQAQNESTQLSDSECDCEERLGVTSWPFPFICAILGAIGVLVVLLIWNTDIGDNLLTTILILYELFNCG
jgi:hypothetical protein